MGFASMDSLIIAAALILSLMVLVRIFRKKLGTLEDYRKAFARTVQSTEKEVRECNLAMSLQEQAAVIQAALEEELELEGRPQGFSVDRAAGSAALGGGGAGVVILHTPRGPIQVGIQRKHVRLRSQNRELHGGVHWELKGPDHVEVHCENLAQTMKCLQQVVRGGSLVGDSGEEFRRRFC